MYVLREIHQRRAYPESIQDLIKNIGTASDINTEGHSLQKRVKILPASIQTFFKKILQQNKSFLIFLERRQRLKGERFLCLE